jgi:endoglucanase
MQGSRFTWFVLLASGAMGCGQGGADEIPITPVGPEIHGLHTVGAHLEDNAGNPVTLRGVNRSGTEYMCVKGGGIFDGAWGLASIAAIASWKANAVRIPLNETCWLGPQAATQPGSQGYKATIGQFIGMLHQFHIVPILELHWPAPGTTTALYQQPMPDADHSVDFWTDVATTFAADDGVVFELYNEPFPESNCDTPTAWQCWRDGCMSALMVPNPTRPGSTMPSGTFYQSVGMAGLLSAVRAVAPNHLVLLGGIQYSNSLSQWSAYAPSDANIAPAWHVYNFNGCKDASCWDGAPAALAATLPIVTTELGEDDCSGTFVEPLMEWLDGHGASYLAWSWNQGSCVPQPPPMGQTARPWPLVTDYLSGRPAGGYAQTFHDRLAAVVGTPPAP